MRGILGVLIGLACLVVIASGGLWLWDRFQTQQTAQAATSRENNVLTARATCSAYVDTLRGAATSPTDYTPSQVEEATQGYVKCREDVLQLMP